MWGRVCVFVCARALQSSRCRRRAFLTTGISHSLLLLSLLLRPSISQLKLLPLCKDPVLSELRLDVSYIYISHRFKVCKHSHTMAPTRRDIQQIIQDTSAPPDELSPNQSIGRVIKAVGNNLFMVGLSDGPKTSSSSNSSNTSTITVLVELPSRFRSTVWIRRGGYVVVDTTAFDHRDNKLRGEIVNVVTDEKVWRKRGYW